MQRLLARQRVDAVLALVVGDKRDPLLLRFVEHDRRDVAGERIGELLQLTGLHVERPDVVDVAVARDLGIDRLVRIDRRRREHQRVVVDELGPAVVVGAERELRLRRVARSSRNSLSLPLTRAR